MEKELCYTDDDNENINSGCCGVEWHSHQESEDESVNFGALPGTTIQTTSSISSQTDSNHSASTDYISQKSDPMAHAIFKDHFAYPEKKEELWPGLNPEFLEPRPYISRQNPYTAQMNSGQTIAEKSTQEITLLALAAESLESSQHYLTMAGRVRGRTSAPSARDYRKAKRYARAQRVTPQLLSSTSKALPPLPPFSCPQELPHPGSLSKAQLYTGTGDPLEAERHALRSMRVPLARTETLGPFSGNNPIQSGGTATPKSLF